MEEAWQQWLTEAHDVVLGWEAAVDGRRLTVVQAAALAELIARALERAAAEGEAVRAAGGD
jgi:hypothetical protein